MRIFIFLLIIQFGFSQPQENGFLKNYRKLNTLNNNPNFFVETIQFTPVTSFTFSMFQSHFPGITHIEIPTLFKNQLFDSDFSFLYGGKFDIYRINNAPPSDLGIFISTGLQYNINNRSFIQANFNYQLNKPNNFNLYNAKSRTSFNLGSGFRF